VSGLISLPVTQCHIIHIWLPVNLPCYLGASAHDVLVRSHAVSVVATCCQVNHTTGIDVYWYL